MLSWSDIPKDVKSKIDLGRKKDLDNINYAGLYENINNEGLMLPTSKDEIIVRLMPKEVYDTKSRIYSAFSNISEIKGRHHIGVISNGIHSLDVIMRYFDSNSIKNVNWRANNSKRVMLVYEAPGRNLDCTYGYERWNSNNTMKENLSGKKNIEKYLEYIKSNGKFDDFQECLSSVWWRLDGLSSEIEKCKENELSFLRQIKRYNEFLYTMISIFGIYDFYCTNLFRFEIFDANGDKEHSLSWDELNKLIDVEEKTVIDIAYQNIFSLEFKKYKPDIILATSNPYRYLRNKKEIQIPVVKIPHPASHQLPEDFRFCINVCHIAKSLAKCGIISENQALDLYRKYLYSEL